MLITFFGIKGVDHFELTPQGGYVKLCVEKALNFGPTIRQCSVSQDALYLPEISFWPKNR